MQSCSQDSLQHTTAGASSQAHGRATAPLQHMERDPWLVDEPHQANAAPADWGALPALPPSLPPRVPRASPEVSPALDGIFEVDADAEDADLDFKGWREEREATAKVDQIAVGDMGTVMQRLRFIMVCYGDSSSPRSACLLLLLECLEDVQRAIARQIAGHRRRGTSAASASSAAAPPRAPPASSRPPSPTSTRASGATSTARWRGASCRPSAPRAAPATRTMRPRPPPRPRAWAATATTGRTRRARRRRSWRRRTRRRRRRATRRATRWRRRSRRGRRRGARSSMSGRWA